MKRTRLKKWLTQGLCLKRSLCEKLGIVYNVVYVRLVVLVAVGEGSALDRDLQSIRTS